jgi:hypothetical protein
MGTNIESKTEVVGEDRRIHPRVIRMELVVRFGGQTYKTANWSMGGFFLDDYEGMLSTGSLVTVVGLGRSARNLHQVNLPARVVRSGESIVAVNYLSLDTEAYRFLQDLMSETGAMRILLNNGA